MVRLDPAVGSEIQKTRPCVIISPDELNRQFKTVILAPMTSPSHNFQTRIPCQFDIKKVLSCLTKSDLWTILDWLAKWASLLFPKARQCQERSLKYLPRSDSANPTKRQQLSTRIAAVRRANDYSSKSTQRVPR